MIASRHTVGSASQLVLIVEDDDHTREMYAEWLIFSGFRVAEAKNGPEAIEKARELRPDVITTDIGLQGGMDGCQPYSESEILRSNEEDSGYRCHCVGNGRAPRTRPQIGL